MSMLLLRMRSAVSLRALAAQFGMDFDDSFFDEEGDGGVKEGQKVKKCAREEHSYTAKTCTPEVHT